MFLCYGWIYWGQEESENSKCKNPKRNSLAEHGRHKKDKLMKFSLTIMWRVNCTWKYEIVTNQNEYPKTTCNKHLINTNGSYLAKFWTWTFNFFNQNERMKNLKNFYFSGVNFDQISPLIHLSMWFIICFSLAFVLFQLQSYYTY